MKAVIEGVIYDEDKAKEVADFENNYDRGDFNWFHETLYLTPKGRWFLAGEGHAMSHYREQQGNGYGAGGRITPLTKKEAQHWLEEKDKVEELEEHFADVLEEA